MLEEHLTQAHDLASRRLPTIDLQIDWMRANALPLAGDDNADPNLLAVVAANM